MPQEITSTFRDEKNKAVNYPILLYEVEVTGGTLYFAEYDQDVVFDSNTYIAFPLTHEAIGVNALGEIDAVKITLSNVNRDMGAVLINNDGLRGIKVTIKMVFANHLDDPLNCISETFYVDSAEVTESVAIFILTSKLDLLQFKIPGRSFERHHCQWVYKKDGCWLKSGGIYTQPTNFVYPDEDCDKTIDGPIGCAYHVNKPRFGGFPTIPSKAFFTV